MDSKGRVTSHLSGLFYRTINLLEEGIIPIYVFDGEPPEQKLETIENRRRMREEAQKRLEKVKSESIIHSQELKKYAQASIRLTNEMVDESRQLLSAMGIVWIQAPSEGEAEAAFLNKQGLSYATGSQDYDSLLFGAVRLIRNLTISGKRKLPGKDIYVDIKPELIELDQLLKKLGISREQLIDIAILIGTDYNPGGVKGVGVKTAYQIIKKYGSIERAIEKGAVPKSEIDFDLQQIRQLFMNPKVSKPEHSLELSSPDEKNIIEILVKNHDFNEERVKNGILRLDKAIREAKVLSRQKGLDAWL
jgi:flap endonuclease-1